MQHDKNTLPPNEKFLIVIILLGLLIAFGIVYCNAQSITVTTVKDIAVSQAQGVSGQETIKADFYIPSSTPKGIVCWEHGGGFVKGNKTDGNGGICLTLAKDGWFVINTNYRLANPFSILGADSVTATKLFWEACYRAIQDGDASVRYAIIKYNLPLDIPVYKGGISAGAVAADESVCWQNGEYSLVDTAKWKNYSNGAAPINLRGSISISGAVFQKSDVDATDKIMIRCYGLKDNTLKCFGGFNHQCRYEGDCIITEQQQLFANNDFYIAFPNATHGLREGLLNIIGKQNMKQAIQFISTNLNSL